MSIFEDIFGSEMGELKRHQKVSHSISPDNPLDRGGNQAVLH